MVEFENFVFAFLSKKKTLLVGSDMPQPEESFYL